MISCTYKPGAVPSQIPVVAGTTVCTADGFRMVTMGGGGAGGGGPTDAQRLQAMLPLGRDPDPAVVRAQLAPLLPRLLRGELLGMIRTVSGFSWPEYTMVAVIRGSLAEAQRQIENVREFHTWMPAVDASNLLPDGRLQLLMDSGLPGVKIDAVVRLTNHGTDTTFQSCWRLDYGAVKKRWLHARLSEDEGSWTLGQIRNDPGLIVVVYRIRTQPQTNHTGLRGVVIGKTTALFPTYITRLQQRANPRLPQTLPYRLSVEVNDPQ